jgi:hypothetical protein
VEPCQPGFHWKRLAALPTIHIIAQSLGPVAPVLTLSVRLPGHFVDRWPLASPGSAMIVRPGVASGCSP